MAVGDIFQSTVYLGLDDRNVSVGLYFYETVARTLEAPGAALVLNTEVKDKFWADYLQPLLSNELLYNGVKTQQVYPTREAPAETLEGTPETGALVSPATNGTNAVLVAEYGETWGPRYRGRMFIPGLPESQISAGRINGSDYGPIAVAAAIYYSLTISNVADATGRWKPCTFSDSKDAEPDPIPAVWSQPVTAQVRPRIATQRRRRTNIKQPS